MFEELSERVVGSSGEIGLWRAVLDQALQDACTKPRVMPCGDRTFSSQETEKARDWFWQADPDFALVCDGAGLDAERIVQVRAGRDLPTAAAERNT
ncbi:MAG: hypothetical protein IH905_09365 [Proteobacteria bacterium]|nr:hypothetical protein [Pseudomonadota bacterium]